MTHIPPLLLTLILSSSSLLAVEASISCTWTKVLPTEEVHHIFLLTSPSPRLYHTSWSGQRALLRCAWSDDAAVIQNYVALCQEGTQEFSHQAPEDVASVFEAEDLCVPMATPEVVLRTERAGRRSVRSVGGADGSEVRSLQRVKRGFIVPGTLWCGSGNEAPSFEDLGVFTETDSCCREHDQCKHSIKSFHSGFGVFNSNIFTISHCDCDNRFQGCLMEAKDSISGVVGYTFFNLLKMHCFEFSHRLQCTERNWFGMCKETKMTLYAEVHPPTVYESPTATHANGTINATRATESLEDITSQQQLLSSTAAASAVATPSANAAAALITTPTAATTPEGSPGPEPDQENTTSTKNQTLIDADVSETKFSCAAFKDLDECRNKIPPQHSGYGLYNPDATTLYHCNCTARLFQTLARQTQLTSAQSRLLGHVSLSCFLLQDCTAGQVSCAAVQVEAQLPQLNHSRRADMEQQRHLQTVSLKVRRPNRGAKRKHRQNLHKLCLRLVRSKLNNSRKGNARRPAVRRRELV